MAGELCREASLLASVARRAARFLAAAAGVYPFFAYGMGIVGSVILAVVAARATGVDPGVAALLGVALGALLASILHYLVAGPVWRYLLRHKLVEERRPPLYSYAAFLGFAAAYVLSPLAPPWYPRVAWYPGLAVSLALLAAIHRARRLGGTGALLLAALLLAATTPLVLMLAPMGLGVDAATGLLLLAYLAAGSYSLREAAARLVESE